MTRRPTRYDDDGRLQRGEERLAFFTHRAVLIYHVHIDGANNGRDGTGFLMACHAGKLKPRLPQEGRRR